MHILSTDTGPERVSGELAQVVCGIGSAVSMSVEGLTV